MVEQDKKVNAPTATTNADTKMETTTSTDAKPVNKRSVFSTDLLRVYYARLFPYSQMFKWLSYGNDPAKSKDNPAMQSDFFQHREFSFTIANDVYIRYLCFRDEEELKTEIQRKQPHKIDIGAVYSVPPKDHLMVNAQKFTPVERELVFDIDLTDYDEVRTGCTPDMMWHKGSWQYMSIAMKVIHRALTEDFGFKHLLWVFSGRRGVHCWVCDPSARALSDSERTAIVNYLSVISGNENTSDRCAITQPLHPSIELAMPVLHDVFDSMVLDDENGQALMKDIPACERILTMIPDKEITSRLLAKWQEEPEAGSRRRWGQLRATVKADAAKRGAGAKPIKLQKDLLKALDYIVILHTYPRIDVAVSTHRNHLLKSPFVIHPKTGKVCVPIFDVKNCQNFDPDAVPDLSSLVDEINAFDAQKSDTKTEMEVEGGEGEVKEENKDDKPVMDDRDKTSLKPILAAFEKQFLDPLYLSIKKEFRESRQAQAAHTGDW